MPRATFTKDFDYRTSRNAIVAYKAGWTGNVPKAHLEAAETAGVLSKEPKADENSGDGA